MPTYYPSGCARFENGSFKKGTASFEMEKLQISNTLSFIHINKKSGYWSINQPYQQQFHLGCGSVLVTISGRGYAPTIEKRKLQIMLMKDRCPYLEHEQDFLTGVRI